MLTECAGEPQELCLPVFAFPLERQYYLKYRLIDRCIDNLFFFNVMCSNPFASVHRPSGRSAAFHPEGDTEDSCLSSAFYCTSLLQCWMLISLLSVPAACTRPRGLGFLSL